MKKQQITINAEDLDRLVAEKVQQELAARERSSATPVPPVDLSPLEQNPDLWTTPPPDPEFEAELLRIVDECGGDPIMAAGRVLTAAASTRPPQPLGEQVRRWRTNPKTGQRWDIAPFMEPSFLGAYIERLQRKRETQRGKSYSAVPSQDHLEATLEAMRRAAGDYIDAARRSPGSSR